MSDDQRRARLGTRHLLAAPAPSGDPVEVARSLVALHSTDPATVFLAVLARAPGATVETIERALYDDRSLVRILGMRRTLFVVPVGLVPTIQAACTRAIAARERRRYAKLIEEAGIAADGAAWLDRAEADTLAALEARGGLFGAQLSADVPALRSKVHFGEGKKWGGAASTTTWVLSLLAADERVVRGRPRGSWMSSQYSWAPASGWSTAGAKALETPSAQADLSRQWLARFGPATESDLAWWTGWTKTATRAALGAIGAVEVDLEGGTGYALADDLEPEATPEPWIALLPALDPTSMGWKDRAFYGGDDKALYDRSGNVAATIWSDGRIVGVWAQRGDGEIALRLLADVGREASAAIDAAAGRLAEWLGPARVKPRFRTPVELELAAAG
jgi:hypothetical protein